MKFVNVTLIKYISCMRGVGGPLSSIIANHVNY